MKIVYQTPLESFLTLIEQAKKSKTPVKHLELTEEEEQEVISEMRINGGYSGWYNEYKDNCPYTPGPTEYSLIGYIEGVHIKVKS